MLSLGAIAGFEENGGFMYPRHQYVRDGAMAVALMLELLSYSGRKLSELVSYLPKRYIIKRRVYAPKELLPEVYEELEGAIAESGARAVAYSYVRDLVVSVGGRLREYVTLENLRLWAVAKLSQRLAFYPVELSEKRLKEVLNYLHENLENLARRVEEYLGTLEAEPEVRKALTEGF